MVRISNENPRLFGKEMEVLSITVPSIIVNVTVTGEYSPGLVIAAG